MKQKLIWIISAVLVLGLWISKQLLKKSDIKSKTAVNQIDSNSYWTCPMHPQIHMDHPGECPICHMKLVQVKAQEAQVSENTHGEVHASTDQLALIGVQRQEVERMDLNVSIPVAGRLISTSSVAFQVYESDLSLVRPGLLFKGKTSVSEHEISGVIVSVDTIVDPTSRTVRVVGRIDKGPRDLITETTFSGVVDIPLKDRVSIPESSVLHTGRSDLVYVFTEGNKLSAREVRLGPKSEGFYEVVSGLEPGEYISSGPNFLIDSETKIRGSSPGKAHHDQ